MYKRTEAYFRGFLDARLYYQRWTPAKPKGHLVITHGQGEHSESYSRVVNFLEGEGWLITAWDWRGHGRSDGLRGFARHFNDYSNDFEIFMQTQILSHKGPYPLVLLSHSMGGLIQLKALAQNTDWPIRAQVLSNPQMGVAVAVPEYKQLAAKLVVDLLPKITLFNEIRESDLTSDPEIIAEFAKDSLRHHRISAGVYLGSLENIDYVFKSVQKINCETYLQISSQDPIVSSEANRKMFAALQGPKKVTEYQGFKHEIYNELKREEALNDLRDFLRTLI
jgi:alpha-beta hydrolase superfamily lysophospholipase